MHVNACVTYRCGIFELEALLYIHVHVMVVQFFFFGLAFLVCSIQN